MTQYEKPDVVQLRNGVIELRVADVAIRMNGGESVELALQILRLQGWEVGQELGVRTNDVYSVMPTGRVQRDNVEKIKASGLRVDVEAVHRPTMHGHWVHDDAPAEIGSPSSPVRKFTKEPASPPIGGGMKAPPRRKDRGPSGPTGSEAMVQRQLHDDPVEQLRYEVQHYYLSTVPSSQRNQWPMMNYEVEPRFIRDIGEQIQNLSREQIVSAIVDVVSGRMNDVNSRRPRPLREGGGDDGRPVITRADGATAWRANINTGTPSARRIMWWRTTRGLIVLARLAKHDDVEMPA